MHQKLTVSQIPYPDWPLESLGIWSPLVPQKAPDK